MRDVLFFIFLIFIFCFGTAHAQRPDNIDSLERVVSEGKEDSNKVNAFNLLAYNFRHSNPDKSLQYALSALELAGKINFRRGEAQAFNQAGNYYGSIGNYPKAMEMLMKTLKIYESLNDKRRLASTCIDLGNIFFSQGNIAESNSYYNRALQHSKETGFKAGEAHCIHNLAGCFYMAKNYDSCFIYMKKYIALSRELGRENDIIEALANIGSLYASLEKYDLALQYLDSSLNACIKLRNVSQVCRILSDKASVYIGTGENEKAIALYLMALDTAFKIKDNPTRQEIYKSLGTAYAAMKKFDPAYNFLLNSYDLKDSLFNDDINKQIAEMKTKYESEKKDKEIIRKDAESKQRTTERNAVLAGLVLVALLAVFVFRGYRQKKKANLLLNEQKAIIEEKNKDITDSINYAKKIQDATLPDIPGFKNIFKKSFVFFRPRDIVSGDFYWYADKGDHLLVAAADCTGHGVPGALMSMIGCSFLNQIAGEKTTCSPSQLLTELDLQVIKALKQKSTAENNEGMDISLVEINRDKMLLRHCGANRPVYIIRNNELHEMPGNKFSIGGFSEKEKKFEQNEFALWRGDNIYLFSDGYSDQFGGGKGKKLMSKYFKEILLSLQDKPLEEHGKMLEQKIDEWKGGYEQVDDILVIGIGI